MLQKTKAGTVSIVHQNIANWWYERAIGVWAEYEKLLDAKGLIHPKQLPAAKHFLRLYRRAIKAGDYFMRRPGGQLPKHDRVRQPQKGDRRLWADDFELALIQRGLQARKAFLEAGHVLVD